MDIELNNDQLECCFLLESWFNREEKQIFSISGAGGTGKTTVIKFFIEQLGLDYDEVLFMTYMGKAANRLAQEGLPAKTIHSTIYMVQRGYKRDENGKLVLDEDDKPVLINGFVKKEYLDPRIKLIVLDEASMIGRSIAEDIISYGIPIIALGDLNQLPPVMDNIYFLQKPDYVLHQIMRQEEGNPIITLSQMVLHNQELRPSSLVSKDGKFMSHIIEKKDLNNAIIDSADIILTCTQNDRFAFNNFIRRSILGLDDLNKLYVGETLICRKNNWQLEGPLGNYLTNGMSGYVNEIRAINKRKKDCYKIDFKPDFLKKCFKGIYIDKTRLFATPEELANNPNFKYENMKHTTKNQFEFGYAITVHLSQGSQWDNVVLILNDWAKHSSIYKEIVYTGITRAVNSVTVVV